MKDRRPDEPRERWEPAASPRVADIVRRVNDADPRQRDGRVRWLTALRDLGWPSHLNVDGVSDGRGHTSLLLVGRGDSAELFCAPTDDVDGSVLDALEAAAGLVVDRLHDCSPYQLATLLRVHVAVGAQTAEETLERAALVRAERAGDGETTALPGKEWVEATLGSLDRFRVGSLEGAWAIPSALDVNVERAFAIADRIEWSRLVADGTSP